MRFLESVWSALQTHLQGVDRATLAIVIVLEKRRHHAALLSRLLVQSRIKNSRSVEREQGRL
jgi:hypothetical protein